MASTNAIFPASAMSMTSPPERGQSITRLPFVSSTPPTTTLRSSGCPSCSWKKSILVPQHPELTDGPVQVHQFFLREGLAPLQDLPRPRVRGAHLGLLLVREGENVQDQELIYLTAVEHVAWTLGRDLGIVVENDRGREQHVLVPFLADQHGPRLEVLAPFRKLPQLLRRVRHRDELSSVHFKRGVGRDEGLAERALPVLPYPRCSVGDPDGHPVDPVS